MAFKEALEVQTFKAIFYLKYNFLTIFIYDLFSMNFLFLY